MAMPAWAMFGAVGMGYKLYQALSDTEWPGTEFPEDFRQEMIESHWSRWGGFCWNCFRWGLSKSDLAVDHVVPIRRGGRNSRQNAQVLCKTCNSQKGDRGTIIDQFFGRGGRRPRRRE